MKITNFEELVNYIELNIDKKIHVTFKNIYKSVIKFDIGKLVYTVEMANSNGNYDIRVSYKNEGNKIGNTFTPCVTKDPQKILDVIIAIKNCED